MHENYVGFNNENLYKSILESRYGDVEYMDFLRFPLSNSEFGDLAQNYKGAKVFSEWFDKVLHNGWLEKVNKQDFIMKALKIKIL